MNLLLFNLRVDRDDTALGFTTDWVNELAGHFAHVTVITMYRGRVEVADNVEVFSAGLERGWSKPRRVLEFYRMLFAALARRRYDCCFSHMMPLFTLLAGPVLKARRVPAALWYAHNHRSAILPSALAFADRALASTRTAFPMETDKLRIVGQGIDTDKFAPDPASARDDTLRLLTIGRISPVKHIDRMVRAFAALRSAEAGLPCRFEIVGEPLSARDEAYMAECQALARELGVADAIEWSGPVPFARIPQAYHRGDLFLSANANGLDKAILEAMASGLAVVAMHPAVAEPLGPYFGRDEVQFSAAVLAVARLGPERRCAFGADLREYVCRTHGLPQLGRRIARELKEIAR
jgi:glycosyltransferase involved in cell wall biosynthesis